MKVFLYIGLFFTLSIFAQDNIIANQYFKNGEFSKALHEYKKLHKKSPKNNNFFTKLIKTHQQLEQYNEAELLLQNQILKVNNPALIVELGYNYQLKGNTIEAENYYNKAFHLLSENPSYVYGIANSMESHSLLNYAEKTYLKAMELQPSYNFGSQLARIYGEQGNIEKMFSSYLDILKLNPGFINNLKRGLSDFITEDSQSENNILLKRTLLKRMQSEPDLILNKLLSWLFVQQKDLQKAFTQEKAIYKRELLSLDAIEELAFIALDQEQYANAKAVFNYIIETTFDEQTKIKSHNELLQIDIKQAEKKDYKSINDAFLLLFETYGKDKKTLDLQVAYAHFLAFYKNETSQASNFLKNSLKLRLAAYQEAKVKLELGDILVLQEKFNEALIYFTQIQRKLKNSTISQEARFKVAQTSYYKGDFTWAEAQLKILKSSTSQLIANDALDLKLLISDNKAEDSLQTALKLYAKADLLAFQNKSNESITILNTILEVHKTETIMDQTLYKQAELFFLKKQYAKAEANYKNIIDNYREEILADDALFMLAELYRKHLQKPEEAKALYEQIIFDYQDSIYASLARKQFRLLRGDAIN